MHVNDVAITQSLTVKSLTQELTAVLSSFVQVVVGTGVIIVLFSLIHTIHSLTIHYSILKLYVHLII